MYLRKRPTYEEWQVVFWMAIVVLAIIGTVALAYGIRAPAGKADIAAQLKGIGVAAWSAALVVWCAKTGAEWLSG
jgi:hypothetical protein